MKRSVLLSHLAVLLLLAAGPIWASADIAPGNHEGTLNCDGFYRKYTIHVPPGCQKGKAMPLALLFHGAGGSRQGVLGYTGWDKKADAERFLVAVPEAALLRPDDPPSETNLRVWQETPDKPDDTVRLTPDAGEVTRPDDIKFVNALLDELMRDYPVDTKRVYATGFSNGAGFTFRLAALLPNRLAACAPVSGLFGAGAVHPPRAEPLLLIIGMSDETFPFNGGYSEQDGQKIPRPPILKNIAGWARVEGFASRFGVRQNHTDPVEGDGVTILTCGPEKGPPLTFVYLVAGMGHEWLSTKRFNATDIIWSFFQQQTLP